MKIKFIRSHGVYRRGQVIDHQYPGAAKELIRRNIAEPVVSEEAKPQRAKRK